MYTNVYNRFVTPNACNLQIYNIVDCNNTRVILRTAVRRFVVHHMMHSATLVDYRVLCVRYNFERFWITLRKHKEQRNRISVVNWPAFEAMMSLVGNEDDSGYINVFCKNVRYRP